MGWLSILKLVITLLPSLIKAFNEIRELLKKLPKERQVYFNRRVGVLSKRYRREPEKLHSEIDKVKMAAISEIQMQEATKPSI